MEKILRLFLVLIAFGVFAFPAHAQAPAGTGPKGGCQLDEIMTDFGCFPNDPAKFVQKFYGIGIGFVSSVSLIALIIGGYDIMTSRGEIRRLNIGKSYILYAITGLLLAIFGYVVIQIILVDVLKVPGYTN